MHSINLLIADLHFKCSIIIWQFKMSNTKHNNPSKQKDSPYSTEQSLIDLKEKGKQVLRKLIPSQSIIMLKKLVQGADTLRRQILPSQRLLPLLTIRRMQNQLCDRPPNQLSNFQQMNKELTHSMLFFHEKVNVPAEDAEIMRLQTQKCYKKIPNLYFQPEIKPEFLSQLITRERPRATELRDQLGDYLDQVEFNVNQQVAYKIKVFISFVNYLTNIGVLADLSIKKIRGTRNKNKVIQEIVVQRAERVNALRYRKQIIQKCLQSLHQVKKLKRLQNYLISQVQAKGKIFISDFYAEYCCIHQKIKHYCCPRMLCKYWDVAYYVERGYQDSFSRSLKNYLCEIITVDEKQLKEVMQPNKTQFATVVLRLQRDSFDQSYEVDEEEIQLVTKLNIEREIASIFQQGINKCTYATDDICEELKNNLKLCEDKLYNIISQQQPLLSTTSLSKVQKKVALDKLSLNKYVRVVELWSSRLKKVIIRQASVIEKIIKAAQELREEYPDKEQVVCSYLFQILEITLLFVDQSLSSMISGRKLSQRDSQPIRQILQQCKQWKNLIIDLKHSPCIWQLLIARFGHSRQNKQIETNIMEGILAQLSSLRRRNVETMIDVYNATSIEQLPEKLQEEEWKVINIPSDFERTLGQVIYGSIYAQYMDNSERKMLSTSLLLDRSIIMQKTTSRDMNSSRIEEEKRSGGASRLKMQFNLQINSNQLTIDNQNFRLISSTISMVNFLHGYLQWVQQAGGVGEQLQNTILSKIMEFIIMYNTHVKDLILNKEALKYGKIKTKSVTGKHLLIAYSQLMFFRLLTQLIANRFQTFNEFAALIKPRIQKNMTDISKKFREVLQLAIRESIQKLVVDPRKEIKAPISSSIEIVAVITKSCDYVRDLLCGDKHMNQFLNVAWCSLYMQKIKAQHKSVTRMIMSSTGSRKSKDIDWTDNLYWKFKELEYMAQNLSELREYLPGFQAILSQLQEQRKKLEHPQ